MVFKSWVAVNGLEITRVHGFRVFVTNALSRNSPILDRDISPIGKAIDVPRRRGGGKGDK